MVDPGNQNDATEDRPRDTDTTLHLTTDFEAQLAALEGEVSPEEKSAIAALPSGSFSWCGAGRTPAHDSCSTPM